MYYNEEMCYIFDYLRYFFNLILFYFSNNFNRYSHTNVLIFLSHKYKYTRILL